MIKKTSNFSFNQIASGLLVPGLLILAGIIGYFLLLPEFKIISSARAVLAEKRTTADSRMASFGGVKNLVADFADHRTELAVIDEALPDSPAIPELLANLESLAKQSGLTVSNIQLQLGSSEGQTLAQKAAVPGENMGSMTVDLEVSGQYPQLSAFILNAERNLRLLDIQSIGFSQSSDNSRTQSYVIQIQTYYQKH